MNMNTVAKSKRQPKPKSGSRINAEKAFELAQKAADAAKSDQEKAVANSRLVMTRNALKAIKFTEIVPPRVVRIAKALNTLTKMANRSAYQWTPEQAEKVIKTLESKVAALKGKLIASAGTGKPEEKFDW
jgi:hypothetical protein